MACGERSTRLSSNLRAAMRALREGKRAGVCRQCVARVTRGRLVVLNGKRVSLAQAARTLGLSVSGVASRLRRTGDILIPGAKNSRRKIFRRVIDLNGVSVAAVDIANAVGIPVNVASSRLERFARGEIGLEGVLRPYQRKATAMGGG